MPLGRKISAAAVFALIIVDIVAGIARNAATLYVDLGGAAEQARILDLITSVIEPTVAVTVCSLPAYRALVFNFRSQSNSCSPQHDAADAPRKKKLSHKLRLLTASIPSPFLEVTILREPDVSGQRSRSQENLVEAPVVMDVLD